MPEIQSTIYEKYRDRGVKVFALYQSESPQQIQDFIEQTGITFPVLQDEPLTRVEFDFPFGVGYPYPRDIVIGKDLTVRSIRNSFNAAEMDALVQELLAETP